MAKLPPESDDFFFNIALLVFLMINYNMPLATIYVGFVIAGAIAYMFITSYKPFHLIPISKGQGWSIPKVITGVAFGVGFILLYNQFSSTPMASVFATTAFGDSEVLTVLVYTFLIAYVETRFFGRTLMQFSAWKARISTATPFSTDGVMIMSFVGAVAVLFHATAKGVTNTTDLMLVFAFFALTAGMIMYYQEVVQAILLHVIVNAKATGLVTSLQEASAYLANPYVIGGVILSVILFVKMRKTSLVPVTSPMPLSS